MTHIPFLLTISTYLGFKNLSHNPKLALSVHSQSLPSITTSTSCKPQNLQSVTSIWSYMSFVTITCMSLAASSHLTKLQFFLLMQNGTEGSREQGRSDSLPMPAQSSRKGSSPKSTEARLILQMVGLYVTLTMLLYFFRWLSIPTAVELLQERVLIFHYQQIN